MKSPRRVVAKFVAKYYEILKFLDYFCSEWIARPAASLISSSSSAQYVSLLLLD